MILSFGILGLAAFLWLALFQTLLAAGRPLGHMAWGGTHRVLPMRLRWASLVSAFVMLVAALAVGQAAGLGPAWLPEAWLRPLLWGFAGLFGVSLLGNALSRSRIERWHGVPLAVLASLSCLILALWA